MSFSSAEKPSGRFPTSLVSRLANVSFFRLRRTRPFLLRELISCGVLRLSAFSFLSPLRRQL